MTPSPSWKWEGKRTISTTTLSPGRAFFAPGSPTKIGREKSVPSMVTRAAPAFEVAADEAVRLPLEDLDDSVPAVRDAVLRGRLDATTTTSPVEASAASSEAI